jgi:hypothetical protein
LKIGDIGIDPVDEATSMETSGLEAGAAMEDDHDVAAKSFRLLGLAHAQAFSGGDHEDDGNDAPGDSEHGEKGADAVGPERAEDVLDEIKKCHLTVRRGSQ